MKAAFEGLRAGVVHSATEGAGGTSTPSASVPGMSWTVKLAGEYARHTGRFYACLCVAGVCASPVVYAVAYGYCRQNRAALIDAAAAFEGDAPQSGGRVQKRGRAASSSTGGSSFGGGGDAPGNHRSVRDATPADNQEVLMSGEDDDIVVSAMSRSVAVVAQTGGSVVAAPALPSCPAACGEDRSHRKNAGTPSTEASRLRRLAQGFFRSVLSVKHATNHVFGTTCARAVLPPYFVSLVRHTVRGLVVNLAVHATLFGVCTLLDVCAPLHATPSADQRGDACASWSSVSGDRGLWQGLRLLLTEVGTGLRHGGPILSSTLPDVAAGGTATRLPWLSHLSWATFFDFTMTTRFAAVGYWSTLAMRVCAVWWCVSGKCGTPWQRTSRDAVQASASMWHRLSPSGLFLVGALGAWHTCTREAVLKLAKTWLDGKREAPAAAARPPPHAHSQRPEGPDSAGDERGEAPVPPCVASASRLVTHGLVGVCYALGTCVLHGLGLVVVDYTVRCVTGSRGHPPATGLPDGVGTDGAASPPFVAVLFSLLSLL